MKRLRSVQKQARAVVIGLAAAALTLGASQAQAVLINGTDVGSLDTVIGAVDSKNSGINTEETLLEQFTCNSLCDLNLIENVNINNNGLVSLGELNYIDVNDSAPGYYLLKFGTGNSGNDMFFLKNEGLLRYLAWSDSQLAEAGLPANHVNSISHYAITEGSGSNVPEPGIFSLLGIALLGAASVRRRQK